MRERTDFGFSLVELMVVATIIGILASILLPGFNRLIILARQTEAKAGLHGIFLSMQTYYSNYRTYPSTGVRPPLTNCNTANPYNIGIGFQVAGHVTKYTYGIASCTLPPSIVFPNGGSGWAAIAQSKDPITWYDAVSTHRFWYVADNMRINANDWLCHLQDPVTWTMHISAAGRSPLSDDPTLCPWAGGGLSFWPDYSSAAAALAANPLPDTNILLPEDAY